MRGSNDARASALSVLQPLAPDAVRAARVRARCHAALAQRRVRSRRRAAATARIAAAVALGGVSALYFAALVTALMQVSGWSG